MKVYQVLYIPKADVGMKLDPQVSREVYQDKKDAEDHINNLKSFKDIYNFHIREGILK